MREKLEFCWTKGKNLWKWTSVKSRHRNQWKKLKKKEYEISPEGRWLQIRFTNLEWQILIDFRRAANGGGEGGRFPLPFFVNGRKCPDFGKKGFNCVYPWVKSFIQNVVLRVTRRKSSKIFPCGASLSCVFDERFIKVP